MAVQTWIEGAAALFTATAAVAAWAAAYQVKAASDEDRRLRVWGHLQVIHDLVSELALVGRMDPGRWQRPQLNLRREVTVVFAPLPKCAELAGADLWKIDEAAYPGLVREAMAEVEAAMGDLWKDVYRWSWFRRVTRLSSSRGRSEGVRSGLLGRSSRVIGGRADGPRGQRRESRHDGGKGHRPSRIRLQHRRSSAPRVGIPRSGSGGGLLGWDSARESETPDVARTNRLGVRHPRRGHPVVRALVALTHNLHSATAPGRHRITLRLPLVPDLRSQTTRIALGAG